MCDQYCPNLCGRQRVIRPLTQLVPLMHFKCFVRLWFPSVYFVFHYLSDYFSALPTSHLSGLVFKHVSVLYPHMVPNPSQCGLCACTVFSVRRHIFSLSAFVDCQHIFSALASVACLCREIYSMNLQVNYKQL